MQDVNVGTRLYHGNIANKGLRAVISLAILSLVVAALFPVLLLFIRHSLWGVVVYTVMHVLIPVWAFANVFLNKSVSFSLDPMYFTVKRPLREPLRISVSGHRYFFVESHGGAGLTESFFSGFYVRILDQNGYCREYHCYAFSREVFDEMRAAFRAMNGGEAGR